MTLNRKMSDIEPVAMMGASLAVASVVLTPFALADVPAATPSAEALGAIVVLGLLCTAAAFVLFGGLLLEVGPGRAAVITYVAPVVAVGLGVAVLGERPGVGAAAGLLLILAGSWLSTDGRLPPGMGAWVARVRRRRPDEPVPERARDGTLGVGDRVPRPGARIRARELSVGFRARIRPLMGAFVEAGVRRAEAPGSRPPGPPPPPAGRGSAVR